MAIRILNAGEAERLRKAVNNDPEFKLVGRYMNVSIVIEFGAEKRLFRVRDGDLHEISRVVPLIDPVDICIRGKEEFWNKLLSPVPPARFQNLRAGAHAGNCEISGNGELYHAYFPAIQRMVNIMREMQNQ